MPDAVYKNVNFIFRSKGINARNVTDTLPEGVYLNLQNCEELAENAMSCRLGTIAINQEAGVWQLLEAPVHSLAKLSGLGGLAWRYAGGGTLLYRIQWGILGTYFEIASGLSGQPWQAAFFTPTDFTSTPYIFFADANGMLKDNGNLVPPQQMGIFQPQFPVQAQVWTTNFTQLEPAGGETYATTGITGFASGQTVAPNTTMTSAVTATGRNTVSVAGTNNIQVNQWLYVGLGGAHQESVFVISVTPTSFTAYFSFTHAVGEAVIGVGIAGEVAAASTTGTVTATYAAKIGPSIGWVQQADYIGLQLFVDQPQNVQQIVLKFDCGDGSFSDYFYKVIGQGALQNLLDTTASTTAQSAATDAIITESLGAYGNAPGAIAELNVGTNVTTPLNIQLSDFASAGRADFNDQTYNWQNVGKYQIEVLTNSGGAVNFKLYSMQMFGGFGPDTFAGVAYDYLVTFYNAADGTESNPCMQMTNQDPPNDTNWVYPRRSPVQLTIDLNTYSGVGILDIDPQITHIRIYRRGGTLGDNWRRVDQVAVAGGGTIQYLDIASDAGIQDSDVVSFTNDVPVTSSLPVPVNTNLTANVTPPAVGGIVNVPVGNMANIFVGQQVTIGTFGALANNVETVIVTGIRAGFFIAFVQNQHLNSEPVTATAVYGQPVTIMTQAFGQMWFAGDPNNPHYLYWSNGNNPQGLSSASWVPVGSPDDPITAIVQLKGNLYVSTGKYWWAVSPGAQTGQQPTVYPTVAKHGCVATGGYAVTEQGIYYQAIDGIRFFAGGASEYLTQEQEFIWQGVGSSPIVEADQTKFSQTRMAYWNNMIFVSYVGLDENYHRMIYHCLTEEAEALTRNGWKHHWELNIGEEILAYNADTGGCEWVPVESISVCPFEGELARWDAGRHSHKFSFAFTEGHKWAWLGESGKGSKWRRSDRARLRPAGEIGKFGNIVQSAPLKGGSQTILEPAEAEVLGWLVTDGSITRNGGKKNGNRSGVVYQAVKSDAIPRLMEILAPYCSSVTPYEEKHPHRAGSKAKMLRFAVRTAFVEALLSKCGYEGWSDLPRIACNLNRQAAEAMLGAMMKADGHEGRQSFFCQKEGKPQTEAVRILAALCGKVTSRSRGRADGCTATGLSKKDAIDCEKIKRSIVPYRGNVWCPSTRLHTWVARSNGTISITGNTIYKRWRNDDIEATSILLEVDTNTLVCGGPAGGVRLDRQNQPFDSGLGAGNAVTQQAIGIVLQTPFDDQGMPSITKSYQELTLDINTQGQTLSVFLIFEDGRFVFQVGTVQTNVRQKVNYNLNNSLGFEYYKVSLQLSGSVLAFPYIYQCSLKSLPLAKTRKSFDSFWLNLGTDESKVIKQAYFEYTSTADSFFSVYYDGSQAPLFQFTLPNSNGIRQSVRVRLPAVSCRIIRFVGICANDFQVWESSKIDMKPLCSGKGYQTVEFVPNS